MAITLNAKGTSVPYFTIGKNGATIYQGADDPSTYYAIKNGDVWLNVTTNSILSYSVNSAGWQTPQLGDLDVVDSTIIAGPSADLTLQTVSGNSVILDAGAGNPVLSVPVGKDLYISDAIGGSLYLNNNKFPAADGTAGQMLSTNGSGALQWVDRLHTYTTTASNSVLTDDTFGLSVVPNTSLTPEAGTYMATFNCDCLSTPTSVTSRASADTNTLYFALMALTPTNISHPGAFGSETIGPGVYTVAAAVSVTGTLTLDAGNNPDALFVIRCGAAFTTGANAQIALINGASSANVFIVSEGAASTGAGTIFRGTLFANHAAASLGAGTQMAGHLLARVGAVSIAASTMTLPSRTSVMALGRIAGFSMFTGEGDISNAGASTIAGDVGTNLGAATGFGSAAIAGEIYLPGQLDAESTMSVYKNGILVTIASRKRATTARLHMPFTLQGAVTASGTDVFDIRSSVLLGTMTVGNRIFTLTEIFV
jgi:hypothetical protein